LVWEDEQPQWDLNSAHTSLKAAVWNLRKCKMYFCDLVTARNGTEGNHVVNITREMLEIVSISSKVWQRSCQQPREYDQTVRFY
jgi:hypothetical protein